MNWKTLLAYITGSVDQALLLRNEYLVTENRILRNQITGRVRLTDGERKTLATIGQQLGKQALREVATIVKPDTILDVHFISSSPVKFACAYRVEGDRRHVQNVGGGG
jgi:putative transposase